MADAAEVRVPLLDAASFLDEVAHIIIRRDKVFFSPDSTEEVIELPGLTASKLAALKKEGDALEMNGYLIIVCPVPSKANVPDDIYMPSGVMVMFGLIPDLLVVDYEVLIAAAKKALETPTETPTGAPPAIIP